MIRYGIFEAYAEVAAFTTEKEDGFDDFPRFTGDDPEIYVRNRHKLSLLTGLLPENFVFPRQTHSDHIALIDRIPDSEIKDADALVTNQTGICLCVQTADCVPMMLFDPVKRVVAAIHAGWRGTSKLIAIKTVATMTAGYGTLPADLLAAIGPAIGPENYEVGPEVAEVFREVFQKQDLSFVQNKKNGKYLLDLWEANRQLLVFSGLNAGNIELSGRCTFQEETRFYSARREGGQTGRNVSGIWLT